MATAAMPLRVALLEERRLFADLLEAALANTDQEVELSIVRTDSQGSGAWMEEASPTVILASVEEALRMGPDVVRRLTNREGATFVVFGEHPGPDRLRELVEAGCRGFAAADEPVAALVESVVRAARGEVTIPAGLLYEALRDQRQVRQRPTYERGVQLTRREQQVLSLIRLGLENKEIARSMGLRPATARSYVQRVLEKLGVHSKLEAAVHPAARERRRGHLEEDEGPSQAAATA